ncbi:MAG: polyprenyl synthetase family protein [Streptococcaceae bacterium]|jgi:heptaprenyl diphosphate synthase|nr:polyprenyl synthetase family protein [Streptococcaceae bacterium]
MVVDIINNDFPGLTSELSKVKQLMKKSVILKDTAVKRAIFDIFDAGGKMLRPAYLLLFSEYSELSSEQRIALAAAVEMLHTATLIHDDIVDRADTRRGVATISAKYGEDVAVYAGDYLFVSVFKTLSKHSLDLSNLTSQTASIERLLGGELGQMTLRYDLTQTIDAYIDNISGKTAELFAMACAVPAMIDGDKKFSKLAYNIGKNIGIAFQIMDDYLDYAADEEKLGKPVLEDMQQGVYSAPILFALKADPEKTAYLLSHKKFDKIPEVLEKTGALLETKQLAQNYTLTALKLIKKLPATDTTMKISNLTKKTLERDY